MAKSVSITTATEQSMRTAETLSQALPFMHKYAGETFVIKYGGHAMGNEALAETFARDIALLKQVGINPIVVHGGGPQISDMLKRLNVQASFVDGLRVTDAATVEVVEMVLSGGINKQIVAAINKVGGKAIGLSGKDANLVRAKKLHRTQRDPDSNIERILDLGFVGEPDEVNPHVLDVFLKSDVIPVIAPLASGSAGETYNINADTMAGKIAAAVKARRFLLLTDVPGVLTADKKLMTSLKADEVKALIADGTISGGMVPKVRAALAALAWEGAEAIIADASAPDALTRALSDPGFGTRLSARAHAGAA
jgi:acetylglutamate kinase